MLRRLCSGLLALPLLLGSSPARAIDRVELQLPLLEVSFTVSLRELEDPEAFWQGDSDLAELNRASNGALGRQLERVFNTPLPVQTRNVVGQVVGTPLLEQALLAATTLGRVNGMPKDLSGSDLSQVLERASASGDLTLLAFLRALPGDSVTVDLPHAVGALQRMVAQRRQAEAVLAKVPAAAIAPAALRPGPLPVRRSEIQVPASHRGAPLDVVVIEPERDGRGRVVLISHGLWDSPESFEGWARHLASHGYRVVLPRHPGSDSSQQEAMLTGKVPPPSPDELRYRPLDVSATIDGLGVSEVLMIGHSWGATTALQVAGVQPSSNLLQKRCRDVNDPERNLSWVLQCSFLSAADRAGLADGRVRAVVAVSPPLSLLFDYGSAQNMRARALLVTGSRDWVVSPDPEALVPGQRAQGLGHQLVLADGGDHFNLRAPADGDGGPLRALLLVWTDAAFAAGPQVAPGPQAKPLLPASGWGNDRIPLVLVP
jgi:predicted dienelactone hydrolase